MLQQVVVSSSWSDSHSGSNHIRNELGDEAMNISDYELLLAQVMRVE